jgi:hypothetical protein
VVVVKLCDHYFEQTLNIPGVGGAGVQDRVGMCGLLTQAGAVHRMALIHVMQENGDGDGPGMGGSGCAFVDQTKCPYYK